jgi:hypothetical protein
VKNNVYAIAIAIAVVVASNATGQVPAPAAKPRPHGIYVQSAKQYDQRILLRRLRAIAVALGATSTSFNLSGQLGNLQGGRSNLSRSGFQLGATAGPGALPTLGQGTAIQQPEVLRTQSSTNESTSETRAEATSTTTRNQTNSNESIQSVTKGTLRDPDPVTIPNAEAVTGPFGFGVQDSLASRLELAEELSNLALLTEGSFDDQLMIRTEADLADKRLRTVLGFNVSIEPPGKGLVAEIDVQVRCTTPRHRRDVSVIALYPRERTYNVSTVSEKATGFGINAIYVPITLGVSNQSASQQRYLVRDHDTVAKLGKPNVGGNSARFGWQFRPVLGRQAVTPGMRSVFASVALPVSDFSLGAKEPSFRGAVTVRTVWRKWDAKRGLATDEVGEPTIDTYPIEVMASALNNQDMSPRVDNVRIRPGDAGKVLVSIEGSRLADAAVLIQGVNSPNTIVNREEHTLSFMADAEDVFANPVTLSGPFGDTAVVQKRLTASLMKVQDARVASCDGTDVEIEAWLDLPDNWQGERIPGLSYGRSALWVPRKDVKPVGFKTAKELSTTANDFEAFALRLGDKLYGTAERPVDILDVNGTLVKVRFKAPAADVVASPSLTLLSLLRPAATSEHEGKVEDQKKVFSVEGVRTVGELSDGKTAIAIMGRKLSALKVVFRGKELRSTAKDGAYLLGNPPPGQIVIVIPNAQLTDKAFVHLRGNEEGFGTTVALKQVAVELPLKFADGALEVIRPQGNQRPVELAIESGAALEIIVSYEDSKLDHTVKDGKLLVYPTAAMMKDLGTKRVKIVADKQPWLLFIEVKAPTKP